MEGKWQEMVALVSDEMLETFAVVAAHGELGAKIKEQWGDIATTIHLDMPPELRENEAAVRRFVDALS